MDAQGTLDQLTAALDLRMTALRSRKFAELQPATFDLGAHPEQSAGRRRQIATGPHRADSDRREPSVQRFEDYQSGKIDENTPVVGSVRMARSSVNFIRQFFPIIIQLDGDLALDAKVNGTIARPVLSGSGDITINMARFKNPSLPAISGLHSRLTFDRDVLNFERFNGDLAGGPFTISGRVTFPKLTEPNLDFQVKAQSVLVARNDSLTARADADIKVTGPLATATVTGNVALTNSQFLKNIDLIPIGLPGGRRHGLRRIA